MSRITTTDVAEILKTALDPSVPTAFVEDAHRIVEQRCGPYTDDEEALATVETYLAAHLLPPRIHASRRVPTRESRLPTRPPGERYWHKAVLADPTNRLARPGGYAIFST